MNNTVSAGQSCIGGGAKNVVSGGQYSFIGGGRNNSIVIWPNSDRKCTPIDMVIKRSLQQYLPDFILANVDNKTTFLTIKPLYCQEDRPLWYIIFRTTKLR